MGAGTSYILCGCTCFRVLGITHDLLWRFPATPSKRLVGFCRGLSLLFAAKRPAGEAFVCLCCLLIYMFGLRASHFRGFPLPEKKSSGVAALHFFNVPRVGGIGALTRRKHQASFAKIGLQERNDAGHNKLRACHHGGPTPGNRAPEQARPKRSHPLRKKNAA